MNENDRLLTRRELNIACENVLDGLSCKGCREALCEAQDAKSAQAERRAVGARLEVLFPRTAHSRRPVKLDEVIEKLKKGETP